MGKSGGTMGMLRELGLLNEIAPDYGELCSSAPQGSAEALCYSRECAGEGLVKHRVIKEAKPREDWCPRCGHALVWAKPGLKGKRRLRGRC